jgi:hypothetical protein
VARAAKKTATRRTTKKTAARRSTRPAARSAAARPAAAASTTSSSAPAPGSIDLAGGLKSLLSAVETEVREVSALSERIDTGLGSFLDKAIRPRKPRVVEVIPKRLTQFQ